MNKKLCKVGMVEGVCVEGIFLDTGCGQTLVRKGLVPKEKLLLKTVELGCVHGDKVSFPLAMVNMELDGNKFQVKAGVADNLPVPVLMGTDVEVIWKLLESAMQAEGKTSLVVTRAMKRREEEEEEAQQVGEHSAGTWVNPVEVEELAATPGEVAEFNPRDEMFPVEDEESAVTPGELAEFNFADEMFEGGRTREKLSKSQRRRNKQARVVGQQWQPLNLTTQQLAQKQAEDETLDGIRRILEEQSLEPGSGEFFVRNGSMYRLWQRVKEKDQVVEQLVLPRECRKGVLRLAHTIPLVGHLRRNKTIQRVLQRFFWPNVTREISRFCKACPQCQKATTKRVCPVPLIPLPIMDIPFKRMAMDIVGPLPRSRSGSKYLLVLCDYATRYPEAIPLRSTETERVAEALVTFFSRVGIPEEILTDQGSNFTSKLMKEVYALLGIKPIRMSPYHPQTDGLVERFNQTLKAMLRRMAQDGKDWDKLVPFVLFAYREVPQASTGFSPFELMFRRIVRGPLDVLKDTWEAGKSANESVVSYVENMREKLAAMTDLVQKNVSQAKHRQKIWYDRHAQERELVAGEKVLVLLPTESKKMKAQWQGPYHVVRKVGLVDYEVDMVDRQKRKRIFHINMLQKWHEETKTDVWWKLREMESVRKKKYPLGVAQTEWNY